MTYTHTFSLSQFAIVEVTADSSRYSSDVSVRANRPDKLTSKLVIYCLKQVIALSSVHLIVGQTLESNFYVVQSDDMHQKSHWRPFFDPICIALLSIQFEVSVKSSQ